MTEISFPTIQRELPRIAEAIQSVSHNVSGTPDYIWNLTLYLEGLENSINCLTYALTGMSRTEISRMMWEHDHKQEETK